MADPSPRALYDGWIDLVGCDGSRRPATTQRNHAHRAINAVFRGDEVSPRPAVLFRRLDFDGDEVNAELFHGGRWQGCEVYEPDTGTEFHLVVKGGRVWKIDLERGYKVSDVTPQENHVLTVGFNAPLPNGVVTITVDSTSNLVPDMIVRILGKAYRVLVVASTTQFTAYNLQDALGAAHVSGEAVIYHDVNPGKHFKCWMEQAEKWMLIQNGENRCIIFDGVSSRRSANDEIPIGTVMAFGIGRLWLAGPDQLTFGASDLIYGSSGTPAERYRDSILKWTENTYLAGGNWFRVPQKAGKIRAMEFIANLDTSTGQGPLQVLTSKGAFSINPPIDRQTWGEYGYGSTNRDPIQTVSLRNAGSESDASVIAINSDLYFRGRDGVRSFQIARRDFGRWANTPISKAVDWVLRTDNKALLQYSSAALFDQRFLCTTGPQVGDRGVVHRGIVSLDMQQVDYTDQTPPQWDGLWTFGYCYNIIAHEVSSRERCFAYTENQSSDVELFEMDLDALADQADADYPTPIRWMFETSSVDFGSQEQGRRFEQKFINGGEIETHDVSGRVEYVLRYRPEGYNCWVTWARWDDCAAQGADCTPDNYAVCRDWSIGKPQGRPVLSVPQPPDTCDEASGIRHRVLYRMQIRIDVRGHVKVGGFRVYAHSIPTRILAKMVNCTP